VYELEKMGFQDHLSPSDIILNFEALCCKLNRMSFTKMLPTGILLMCWVVCHGSAVATKVSTKASNR
jgi:hypothetical protein